MNDRYLFRGKRVDNGRWETGFLVIERAGTSEERFYITDKMTGYHTPIIPETVGQCTGLKDKNGKLIFEGDILMFTNDDGEKTPYKVKWSTSLAQYIISMGDGIFDTMDYWDKWIECYEIISNIHDNPELLEVEENDGQ